MTLTKDEIKAITTVPEILQRYGVEIKRGRCKAICHAGSHYTAKVSRDLYYCFKCNVNMDIFDLTMHFNNCDFRTAFELLGGSKKPSFTAYVKANQTKAKRYQELKREAERQKEYRTIINLITAYSSIIAKSEPMSNIWCYCINKLQYQIYLLELHDEKR